jgi:hypothetical protein
MTTGGMEKESAAENRLLNPDMQQNTYIIPNGSTLP